MLQYLGTRHGVRQSLLHVVLWNVVFSELGDLHLERKASVRSELGVSLVGCLALSWPGHGWSGGFD